MKTNSAGTRSKQLSTSSEASDKTKASKDRPKCPTPRYSTFSIDAVLNPKPGQGPFKYLSFDLTSKHRRQPSVIFKDLNEIYSESDLSDEECISDLAHHTKNSIFESTADRKSSKIGLVKKKLNFFNEIKPDDNVTTQITMINEGRETPVGILPKVMYCEKCKLSGTTLVRLKMPTLPFWRVACCISSVTDVCVEMDNFEKFQEFQHKCRSCNSIIAVGHPM